MAALIGTASHARQILTHWRTDRWANQELDENVWRNVGNGGTRHAFLHVPTGVVYKVDSSEYGYHGYMNADEIRNARRLLRRFRANGYKVSKHVQIPLTSAFRVKSPSGNHEYVIAMQYIEGTMGNEAKVSKAAREELFSLGFGDMHGYNYIVTECGTVWPVDMGSALRPGRGDPRARMAAGRNV